MNDTLPKLNIGKLSLLRIDVDSYSSTREVLENLYHKVVVGGVIIFDDTCLVETCAAINDFFTENNIPINLIDPVNDTVINFLPNEVYPCGSYIIKTK